MSSGCHARDPGLQAERTALAWTRTAVAILVNAVLVLRTGIAGHSVVLMALSLTLLMAAALTFMHGKRRAAALRANDAVSVQLQPSICRAVSVVTVLAGLTGTLCVLYESR